MKKLLFTLILASMSLYIFGQAGTVISGMPTVFGFGSDDKQDNYAPQGPHQWKNGQGTACWDYSYAYLVPGWADNWGSSSTSDGAWAKSELQYWESRGQIQVFTYYYSYGDKSWFNNSTNMTKYWKELKLLFQVINANTTKKVIVHFEPDGIGFWKQANQSTTASGAMLVGSVAVSSGVTELSGIADSLQGWSAAIVKLRDTYAPGKALLAHHYTHWATGADIFSDSQQQGTVDTHVTSMTDYIKSIENGIPFDYFFVDPSDRDADWYRLKKSTDNRWTDPSHTWTDYRSWGKIGYITNKISDNLARRGFMWQIPEGNTYYKTCNNSVGHYRDNHAQEFIPSTSANGSGGTPGDAYSSSDTSKGPGFWGTRGIVGVLFGSGYYQDTPPEGNALTHTRDNPTDSITNPTSDSLTGGPSFDVWGQATSNVADNDGGYIRNAVAKYCSTGKYSLGGGPANTPTVTSTFSKTNTPIVPTLTFTRTNTPIPPTVTITVTNTPIPPSLTFTRTNTPIPPSFTITRTNTPIPPSATLTSTFTNTTIPPSATFTRTITPSFTRTYTITPLPPTETSTNIPAGTTSTFTPTFTCTLTITFSRTVSSTYTRTNTATNTMTKTITVPTLTNTQTTLPTASPTNPPAGSTYTFTPTNTIVLSPTLTSTRTNTAVASTFTNTPTQTVSNTKIPTAVSTATITLTYLIPATALPTNTRTFTPTMINTATLISTAIFTVTPTFTSTIEAESDKLIITNPPVVYPNPNPGFEVNLKFNLTRHASEATVKIFTTSRRLIRKVIVSGSFVAGDNKLSFGREYLIGLAQGTYIYKLSIKDGQGRQADSKAGVLIIQY